MEPDHYLRSVQRRSARIGASRACRRLGRRPIRPPEADSGRHSTHGPRLYGDEPHRRTAGILLRVRVHDRPRQQPGNEHAHYRFRCELVQPQTWACLWDNVVRCRHRGAVRACAGMACGDVRLASGGAYGWGVYCRSGRACGSGYAAQAGAIRLLPRWDHTGGGQSFRRNSQASRCP